MITLENIPFKIDIETGLLRSVAFVGSPHHDERPMDVPIDLIVIHGISLPPGQFGSDSIERFFQGELNCDSHPDFADIAALRVSSHLLIKRTGEVIQFVPFQKRAWHAGVSSFQGRNGCNDFSIGIELEGTDDIPYEGVQYQTLSDVIREIMRVYPSVTKDRIVGHVHIAPTRKTDPGAAFNWDYLKGMLT